MTTRLIRSYTDAEEILAQARSPSLLGTPLGGALRLFRGADGTHRVCAGGALVAEVSPTNRLKFVATPIEQLTLPYEAILRVFGINFPEQVVLFNGLTMDLRTRWWLNDRLALRAALVPEVEAQWHKDFRVFRIAVRGMYRLGVVPGNDRYAIAWPGCVPSIVKAIKGEYKGNGVVQYFPRNDVIADTYLLAHIEVLQRFYGVFGERWRTT